MSHRRRSYSNVLKSTEFGEEWSESQSSRRCGAITNEKEEERVKMEEIDKGSVGYLPLARITVSLV